MIQSRHRRAFLLIAVIAIGIALLMMLAPQTHGADNGAWLAVLPILFVGLISPLNLLSSVALLCLGSAPSSPVLPSSFQRPPPFQLA